MADTRALRLKISTGPDYTFVWAPNEPTASEVRIVLDAGGHVWMPAERLDWDALDALPAHVAARPDVQPTQSFPLATDVEIGVTALEACQTLAAAGYTFEWHPEQHRDSRDGWEAGLPGMT